METVRRMHPAVRPQARYERSIDVLQHIRESGLVTKTGIMNGIGERDDEVFELMQDLRDAADIHILTVGQYLQPTRNHLPIDRWVTPESFDQYRESGLELGFSVVESGPLVRSSYHAEEQAAKLSYPTGGQRRHGSTSQGHEGWQGRRLGASTGDAEP